MLIVLEGKNVYQKLELMHAGTHAHRHFVLQLHAAELIYQRLFPRIVVEVDAVLLQDGGHFAHLAHVALQVGLAQAAATRLDREVGVDGEARHIVVAGTHAHIVAYRHCHINADTHRAHVHANVHVVQDILPSQHRSKGLTALLGRHRCRQRQGYCKSSKSLHRRISIYYI